MRNKKLVYTFLLFFVLPGCKSYLQEKRRVEFAKYEKAANSKSWILFEQSKWQKENTKDNWFREQEWYNIDAGIAEVRWISIQKNSSVKCAKKYGKEKLYYVGKWYYVKKLDTKIRLIACGFSLNYESISKENKNILYKPLAKTAVNRDVFGGGILIEEARIKWSDKYGYNAYYDLKTGTIKQAEE